MPRAATMAFCWYFPCPSLPVSRLPSEDPHKSAVVRSGRGAGVVRSRADRAWCRGADRPCDSPMSPSNGPAWRNGGAGDQVRNLHIKH